MLKLVVTEDEPTYVLVVKTSVLTLIVMGAHSRLTAIDIYVTFIITRQRRILQISSKNVINFCTVLRVLP